MKRIILNIIFCIFCSSVYAQNYVLERDSLSIFAIHDKELASIFARIIAEANKINDHNNIGLYIYIDICDNSMLWDFNIRKRNNDLDSLVLYKSPHYQQFYITNQDMLLQTNVESYSVGFYNMLTNVLKELPIKQCIYFKDPPLDFYDSNLRGEDSIDNSILDIFYEYDGNEWHDGYSWLDEDGNESRVLQND